MWDVDELTDLLPERLQWLPLNIAMVEADGTIVRVNKGWRNFGDANGLRWEDSGIGLNYFDVCSREQVRRFKEIVAGERNELSFMYACHAPREARWMELVAVPLSFEAPTGLLMMHYDITRILPQNLVEGTLDLTEPPRLATAEAMAIGRMIEQTTLSVIAMERMGHAAQRGAQPRCA